MAEHGEATDGPGGVRYRTMDIVVAAMLPGQACPELSADHPTADADAFVGASAAAQQTVAALAADRPVAEWPMSPQLLRRFVQGARACDLRAAVGLR